MRTLASVLSVVASALLAASVATAKPKPPPPPPNPPLTEELLTATNMTNIVLDCDDPLGPTIEFDATGVSGPPYAGTFTEHVAVRQQTVGTAPVFVGVPPTGQLKIDSAAGPLATLQADFTIISAAGIVTGSKTVLLPAATNSACGDIGVFTLSGIPASTVAVQHFFVSAAHGSLSYAATITTPLGTSSDSGTANMDAGRIEVPPAFGGVLSPALFQERFVSTALVPSPTKPGKGCGDKNHVHERTSECDK